MIHLLSITDISEVYQTYRGTQFNLTLCDLPIKKLLASQRKQICSEASSTHFSDINLSYTHALPIILLIDPNKSQTFRKTIRVIAEHNSIWLCDLLIKTLLASQRNQIYSEASSTHFWAINLSYITLYRSWSSLILINHRHFRKLSELSRITIQFDTLWFTNQNTARLPTQTNIFWSIFYTLFSY